MSHIWLETPTSNQFILYNSAAVPITDRGLTYGDGLFETIRVLESKPLFISRHLARLLTGLEVINLPIPWGPTDLINRCQQLIARNQLTNGVVRITITRGTGPRGFVPPANPDPTLIIQTFESHPAPTTGLKAIVAPWRIDPYNPLCHLKHLAALDKVLAKDLARKQEADEAIFLNINRHIAETTSWNTFMIAENQILTPALHCGVLPGITRQVLLELAPSLGYRIIETELSLDMLTTASEAFLTNAVSGIRPLTQVSGQPIGIGSRGPITEAIATAYQSHLLDEIRG
jgi:branched-chain amino acid aminotransferase